MKEKSLRTTEIQFTIGLDENHTPETINWTADEAETREPQSSKALLISIWDPEKSNTVRFDLWTKDMRHDEMAKLIFQSFLMMGETYSRATGNKEIASQITQFAEHFGVKTGIIGNNDSGETPDDEIKPFKLKV